MNKTLLYLFSTLSLSLLSIKSLWSDSFLPTCTETQHSISKQIASLIQQQSQLPQDSKPNLHLDLLEKQYLLFPSSGCYDYLLQAVLSYKNFFFQMKRHPSLRNPMRESTLHQYNRWLTRSFTAQGSISQSTSFLLPIPPLLQTELISFSNTLLTEQIRMKQLLFQRNVVLIPSAISLAIGVTLTMISGILFYFDLKPDGNQALYRGQLVLSVYDTRIPAAVTLSLGLTFTIGGATGLGISLYKASKLSSPIDTP